MSKKIKTSNTYGYLTIILRDQNGAEINFDIDGCVVSHSLDTGTRSLCITWDHDDIYFGFPSNIIDKIKASAADAKVTIVNAAMDELFAEDNQEEGA